MFSWFRKKREPTDPAHLAPPAVQRPRHTGPSPDADEVDIDVAPPGGADAGKTPAGPRNQAYPRLGTRVRLAFADGERKWEEEADLVQLLARTLGGNGHPTAPHDDGLLHRASRIVLCPNLCGLQPRDRGAVSTTTLVESRHPAFGGAKVFEFQHSTGQSVERSIGAGFDQWRQFDLPVLLDALREKPADCMAMQMTFPSTAGAPPRARRVLLGPVGHFRQLPAAASPTEPHSAAPEPEGGGPGGNAEHDFCPCCLFTRSIEAFKSLVESERFFAIRFFAARDGAGRPQADCRVNGEDWEAGKAALLQYAATWPAAGYELRKQYVVLQSVRPGTGSEDGA